VAQKLILFFHLIGFGLFVAAQIGGFLLEMRYRKATEMSTKALILGLLRPFGLLGPVATLIMLVSGIGNMVMLNLGVLSEGWLTAKILFFALATVAGLVFGMKSRARGALIRAMAKGESPADAESTLKGLERQVSLSYIVTPLLLVIILLLTLSRGS
jgi:uncharacterized membrane protein SirB2